MHAILESIDNRDLALCFWLAVLFAWILCKPSLRRHLKAVWKAVTHHRILIAFGFAAATVAALSYLLNLVGLWTLSQLKGSVAWFLVACIPSMMDIPKLSHDFGLFRTAALKNFELSVLVDFYVNLFHAALLVEIILLPVATALTAMIVLAELKPELKAAHRPLTSILAAIGICWLVFQAYKLASSFEEVRNLNTVRDFVLPLALNLAFLPVLVLYAVYAAYDSVFANLQFVIKQPALRRFAKISLLLRCGLNYMRARRWLKQARHADLDNRALVWRSVGQA